MSVRGQLHLLPVKGRLYFKGLFRLKFLYWICCLQVQRTHHHYVYVFVRVFCSLLEDLVFEINLAMTSCIHVNNQRPQ